MKAKATLVNNDKIQYNPSHSKIYTPYYTAEISKAQIQQANARSQTDTEWFQIELTIPYK